MRRSNRYTEAEVRSMLRRAREMAELSPRMMQVLECLRGARRGEEIALTLNLTFYTVRDYIQQLYERFNVSGRAELLACFTRR